VIEIVEQLDLSALTLSYRGAGSAAYHPSMLLEGRECTAPELVAPGPMPNRQIILASRQKGQ